MEKVRTRSKAIDRLVEFVELSPSVDEIAVAYSNESTDLENLLRRIDPIFPRDRIVLGKWPGDRTHAGPNGLGVFVSQGCDWLR